MKERPNQKIVLASSSSIRKVLLSRLGLDFEIAKPTYIEHDLALPPEIEALEHARGKVRSVAPQHPNAIIIGSDQLLFWGEKIHRKPATASDAAQQLKALRGIEHRLYTSLVVCNTWDGISLEDVVVSRLMIDENLTNEELFRYVMRDHPAGCAGGYKLESLGISLFSEINTTDFTAILGLPLMTLSRFLRFLGFQVP